MYFPDAVLCLETGTPASMFHCRMRHVRSNVPITYRFSHCRSLLILYSPTNFLEAYVRAFELDLHQWSPAVG